MSTPQTWSPQPPEDRRTPPPQQVHGDVRPDSTAPAAPAPTPVDPFRVPDHPTPQYAAPQYAAPQYAAPTLATSPYDAAPFGAPSAGQRYVNQPYVNQPNAGQHPTADPYGAPAPGFNPGATPYAAGYAYGPGNTYAAQRTSGLAIASLVTSLAGFLLPITAPVGLVLGIIALRGINRDGTQGRGLAIGGIAVGAVMTLAFVFGVIAFVGLIAAFPDSGSFTT